jgi:hypothetical protein
MSDNRRIVQLGSLAEFCQEVPVSSHVRLISTEQFGSTANKFPIPTVTCNLDLFGINIFDEIVWLHTSYETYRVDDKFLSRDGEQICELYPKFKELVNHWLIVRGYTVRGGSYAIPVDVKLIRGVFECVRWDKHNGRITIVLQEAGRD